METLALGENYFWYTEKVIALKYLDSKKKKKKV